jgi:hypothetical protein
MDVTKGTTSCTHAQGVERLCTEPVHALELRRLQLQTPYRANTWEITLQQTGLIDRFPFILSGLCNSFIVGYPMPSHVQTPPNSTSLALYDEAKFGEIVDKKLDKGCYIGPLPFSTIEAYLGPFQSSPLLLIPKPNTLGKFCLVQIFSFPIETSPRFPSPSINNTITTEFFPCTWAKFSTIYLLISRLPAGSQVATHDMAEAYHTILLHESQWPAAVVRISKMMACIDTCVAFGAAPSCGTYGQVADAGTEILRTNGIGPLNKWVDDHVFFRVPRSQL